MEERLLREAIQLSMEKMEAGEGGPFGAIVARGGEIVGTGWNRVTSTNDPTAHAEIVAIRDACSRLGTFTLSGCDIYSSCQPCPMCLAAIYWARLERLYYAASAEDAARAGFDDSWIAGEIVLPPADRHLPTVQQLRDEARAAATGAFAGSAAGRDRPLATRARSARRSADQPAASSWPAGNQRKPPGPKGRPAPANVSEREGGGAGLGGVLSGESVFDAIFFSHPGVERRPGFVA